MRARHRERLAVFVEDGLHESLVGPRSDEALLALLAEQQADPLGEQRLAGAGLAGDHVEPGSELEPGLGDEHEVGDGELSEHRPVGAVRRRPLEDMARAIEELLFDVVVERAALAHQQPRASAAGGDLDGLAAAEATRL